jgi:hypothetical protein
MTNNMSSLGDLQVGGINDSVDKVMIMPPPMPTDSDEKVSSIDELTKPHWATRNLDSGSKWITLVLVGFLYVICLAVVLGGNSFSFKTLDLVDFLPYGDKAVERAMTFENVGKSFDMYH